MTDPTPLVVSGSDAARIIGINRRTFYLMVHDGLGPPQVNLPGTRNYLFSMEALNTWIRDRTAFAPHQLDRIRAAVDAAADDTTNPMSLSTRVIARLTSAETQPD